VNESEYDKDNRPMLDCKDWGLGRLPNLEVQPVTSSDGY
jgi:hypothetical protein